MPTKRLPLKANLAHLKHQAHDLLAGHSAGDPAVLQRLREFYPRFRALSDEQIKAAPLKLSGAQLATAREYGFASWPKLKTYVEGDRAAELDLPMHERITDPVFRRAVDLMDDGDVIALRDLLKAYPDLVRRRVEFDGGNYFRNPALIEFIAENPTRRGKIPPNVAQIASVLLDAGAAGDREALDSALGLVASSCVTRECGVQRELIALLCGYGADPTPAVLPALLYREVEGVDELRKCGAETTLSMAAALGEADEVKRLLPFADDEERQLALSLAAQHRRFETAKMLLDAGADPARYTPVTGHAHATALHQAALSGDERIVRLFLDRGARTDLRDTIYGGTPAGWADHAGHRELAALLGRALQ